MGKCAFPVDSPKRCQCEIARALKAAKNPDKWKGYDSFEAAKNGRARTLTQSPEDVLVNESTDPVHCML